MELSWFKQPAGEDPGSLNLCFNALDRHVVHGRAETVALVAGDVRLDFATLVERAASLGGALRSLGVGRGVPVSVELPPGVERLLVLLAVLRLGAVYVEGSAPGVEPHLAVDPDLVQPATKAGRNDPAGCEPLPPDATALVVDGEPISLLGAIGHESWAGAALAYLVRGDTVTLTHDIAESA